MHIPKPLYKSLPLLYTLAGIGLLPVFGLSIPIAISAFMLLGAAGLVTLWRHRHQAVRSAQRQRAQWAKRRDKRAEDILI